MWINCSVHSHKPQYLCLIELKRFTWIYISRSHDKRLICQHTILPASGQDADHTNCHVSDIFFFSLNWIILLMTTDTDQLFYRCLNNILCVEFFFQNPLHDKICIFLILQEFLLHLKDCCICLTDFAHRKIIDKFQFSNCFFSCFLIALNLLLYIFYIDSFNLFDISFIKC